LDKPGDVYDSVQELDAEKSSPINLASKYLATFLADTKDDYQAGSDTLPLNFKANKLEAATTTIQDDNDFSIEF
jgi:hypothetical protein